MGGAEWMGGGYKWVAEIGYIGKVSDGWGRVDGWWGNRLVAEVGDKGGGESEGMR